jgi:hypothetical protein
MYDNSAIDMRNERNYRGGCIGGYPYMSLGGVWEGGGCGA